MKRFRYILALFFPLAGLITGLTRCQHKTDDTPYFLNLNDTVDYVGIETCRSCHSGHYETFIQTGMGSSFGRATREKSKAVFNHKPVYDARKDMYYLASWQQDRMVITEFRLRGKDTVHMRSEIVDYIIGSGHHTNSHLWEENGYIFQAPLTWYSQKGTWDLPPGFESTNTGFGRKIDMECMSCHNAIPKVAEGSVNLFTKVPEGIDCERCHGPGELHVNLKRSGELVDVSREADRSIVNPARLPWSLQVDVCQRCHLQGNNVLKSGKKFTDFRPGMALGDVFEVYMPAESTEGFFMAGHSERLQMSECFKKSNTGKTEIYNPDLNFTCITCHNPHVSVRKTQTEVFNKACSNCHSEKGSSRLKKCIVKPEEWHAKKGNCVGCHMPATGTEDIPHVSIHDHYIRRNYEQKTKAGAIGKLYSVNTADNEATEEAEAYITWFEKFDPKREYLNVAAQKIRSQPRNIGLQIHFYYASGDWKSIVSMAEQVDENQTDAWTAYRLAKAYDRLEQLEASLAWYKKALELQKKNPDFAAEYCNALIRANRVTAALELLKEQIREHPKNHILLTNAGLASINTGNIANGLVYLKKAVQLDPDYRPAYEYLFELYRQSGDRERAQWAEAELKRLR